MRHPLAKIGVAVALLAALLWWTEAPRHVGTLVESAAPQYLVLALLVITLDRLLMSYKWLRLLASQGPSLPLFHGFKIYCAAMTWGTFLPTTVGADALRGVLTSRSGLDTDRAFASIAVERLIGFLAALVLGLAALVILSRSASIDERFDPLWWAGAAVLAVALSAVVLSFSEAPFERLVAALPRRLRASRFVERLRRFHTTYRGFGMDRPALALFFVLTLAEQVFMILGPWLIALGLGVDVSLLAMIGVVPLAIMASRLPVSVDGIGVFEAVFVLLMSLVGVGEAEALAVALTGRLLQAFALLPWWLAFTLEAGRVRPPAAEPPRA